MKRYKNAYKTVVVLCGVIILSGCSVFNSIDNKTENNLLLKSSDFHPKISTWFQSKGYLKELPKYNSEDNKSFAVDLRSYNLSKLNLINDYETLSHADFNSRTIWPKVLPANFNPVKVMEIGKNPGLGIRKLHKEGITGKGVSIAIIDQRLLRTHEEYKDRIKLYKEFGFENSLQNSASMHGPAVASIAVGKTCGVAPDANLYYIAANNSRMITRQKFEVYYDDYAKAIEFVIDLNKILPVNEKIRVISISLGYIPNSKNVELYKQAIKKAIKNNILVVYTAMSDVYHYRVAGLGRDELSNPDEVSSYLPGLFYRKDYYSGNNAYLKNAISVPMDCRTTAGMTGNKDYSFYVNGGLSWTVPWLAGMYALACQVDPKITPEQFLKIAYDTGTPAIFKHDGKVLPKCGNIINPDKIIKTLVGK